jgi:predicted acylesterase/phospholipase RssA
MLCRHVIHVMLQAGVEVAGIMGTSAGALTGSLYAAGYTPKEVCQDRQGIAGRHRAHAHAWQRLYNSLHGTQQAPGCRCRA